MNWTKVGLKGWNMRLCQAATMGLNWTKVGLKVLNQVRITEPEGV